MSTADSTAIKIPHNLRVFVSHVHEDSDLCRPLLTALDAWGVERWFDDQSLHAGDTITTEIYQAISERDIFIRICTATMQRRPQWVEIETHLFQSLAMQDDKSMLGKRRMISVILDASFRLDQFCRDFKYLDAVNKEPRVWLRELREALGLIVGTQQEREPIVRHLLDTETLGFSLEQRDWMIREANRRDEATRKLRERFVGTPILELQAAVSQPSIISVPSGNLVVGRMGEDTLDLYDTSVSSKHAKIHRADDDQCTVFDLESTNGTYVNGERVRQEGRQLNDGDLITVGQTTFRFKNAR